MLVSPRRSSCSHIWKVSSMSLFLSFFPFAFLQHPAFRPIVCCGTISADLGFLPGDASEPESAWSSVDHRKLTGPWRRSHEQLNPLKLQQYGCASMDVHAGCL
ncbi:hypothetical protein BJX76DRAFT_340419 [Aspergillus varians]